MTAATAPRTWPDPGDADTSGPAPRQFYTPMLVLLGVALAARAATMALYFPAVITNVDEPRFARAGGPQGLFDDYWMPAGYPAFLKVVHHVSDQVWVSIGVQHLIGLAVGVVVFLAVDRVTAPGWLATTAAAVALLSGDVLYLEHMLMSDAFLFAMSVFAIAAAARGLIPRTDWRWLLGAGALAAAAMLSRSVGVAVVGSLTVCALLFGGRGRRRLLGGGAVLAGALVILGLYVAAFEVKNGRYLGLSDMRGWNLYSRVAPFAECSKFTPPRGTRVLCESTPPSQRLGPFEYSWDVNSVSLRHFQPEDPTTGGPLGRFANQVLLHQPGDYAEAVGSDLLRYIEPSAGPQRGYAGQGREIVSFGYRNPIAEGQVTAALEHRYSGVTVHAGGAHELTVYQSLFRIDRLVLLAALVLTLAGAALARGPIRVGVWLFGLTALGLYLIPTMTLSYDFRYGIPPGILLTVSGLLGAYGIVAARGVIRDPVARRHRRIEG